MPPIPLGSVFMLIEDTQVNKKVEELPQLKMKAVTIFLFRVKMVLHL